MSEKLKDLLDALCTQVFADGNRGRYEPSETTVRLREQVLACLPSEDSYIDVVFDGPPDHRAGHFVEVENPRGYSVSIGTWVALSNGHWALRIPRPTSLFEDVGAFHEKMGLPHVEQGPPQCISYADLRYRYNFHMEEHREWLEGDTTRMLPQIADALADLVWVVLGTAHYYRIPFDQVWAEVRRANMEKRPWQEGDPVKPRNYTSGEVVKPLGWRPPNVAGVLEERTDLMNGTISARSIP